MNIRLILKKIIDYKYSIYIFFLLWFLVFLALSLFRDSSLDENIYIGDSVEIANILRSGEWIGDYGVGLHGFINKLLIGIIYIFTGPSVFIATLSNIIFAILSGILFFKVLNKHFEFSRIFSFLGVTMLFSSYQFLMYTPTFYRDIMALFFSLLVLDSILSKKSRWLTGVYLLLLLDSKEHVFYTISIGLVLWIGIESVINNKNKVLNTIEYFVLNCVKLFLPSLVLLILMFSTSIIPLNIYNANILGLIDGGIKPMASNFELDMATHNRDTEVNKELARIMPTFEITNDMSLVESSFLLVINTLLSYIGKILYPRTFSFLSIPLIIVIPSVLIAYRYFINSVKKKETTKIVVPIVLFVYLLIYILHASISRYILPISPIVFIFFLLFLKNCKLKTLNIKRILLFTAIFIVAGLFFEYSFVGIKILINILLYLLLLFICFNKKFNGEILKYLFIFLMCCFSAGTSLLASYFYGQIRGFKLYGYNRECEKIVSLIGEDERVLINDINWDRLPFILREENLGEAEWRWSLQKWIPKKALLKEEKNVRTYNFYWGNIDSLRSDIQKYNIQKIVYVKLNKSNEKEDLLLQDRLEVLLNTKWLNLEMKKSMKNKDVYIFNVSSSIDD